MQNIIHQDQEPQPGGQPPLPQHIPVVVGMSMYCDSSLQKKREFVLQKEDTFSQACREDRGSQGGEVCQGDGIAQTSASVLTLWKAQLASKGFSLIS